MATAIATDAKAHILVYDPEGDWQAYRDALDHPSRLYFSLDPDDFKHKYQVDGNIRAIFICTGGVLGSDAPCLRLTGWLRQHGYQGPIWILLEEGGHRAHLQTALPGIHMLTKADFMLAAYTIMGCPAYFEPTPQPARDALEDYILVESGGEGVRFDILVAELLDPLDSLWTAVTQGTQDVLAVLQRLNLRPGNMRQCHELRSDAIAELVERATRLFNAAVWEQLTNCPGLIDELRAIGATMVTHSSKPGDRLLADFLGPQRLSWF